MSAFRLGGALLAAVLLLPTVSTATANASVDDRLAPGLTLTTRSPHGPATTARLTCRPPGGTHPDPKAACAEIAAAGGDFDRLPGASQLTACTMVYRPVIASARGWWHGRPVWWRHKYGNSCTMRADTGTVFGFN